MSRRLIPFFAFTNLGRGIGESRLKAMLFGTTAISVPD
jgi:hypothetical protein